LPLEEVNKDSLIINSSGRYCVEINRQLNDEGYIFTLDFMEFLFLFDLPFQAETSFNKYVSELIKNRGKIVSLYCALADRESRTVLNGILDYRLTLDSFNTKKFVSPYDEEFFAPDILTYGNNEVFVDGGAYDGDSFETFSAASKKYEQAYLFEPDFEIYRRAEKKMSRNKNVTVCNYGLWSVTDELFFSSTGGMDGSLSKSGDIQVDVVSVDDFIKEKITHLKLDVEGAEEEALMGAANHLHIDRPKLAVAVYHKACDLWDLPALIEKLGGKFSFSIRHYSQTIDDSIVYAIPKNK
jgi:FkbM family methyltransferase